MAHAPASQTLLGLARSFKRLNVADPLTQCLAPRATRASFATQTELSAEVASIPNAASTATATAATTTTASSSPRAQPVYPPGHPLRSYTAAHPLTLHAFPSMEPTRLLPLNPAYLPRLRRDILHRAVIYEADMTRQGTASTKHRTAVHGSNRKIQPQKGTGRARAGDKKSPIRRGGGVAFGPHPRDFSTRLNRKVYDAAWRMAVAYRMSRGELVVVDGRFALPEVVVPMGHEAADALLDEASELRGRAGTGLLSEFFQQNGFGKAGGRSLLVTAQLPPPEGEALDAQSLRDEERRQALFGAMEPLGAEGVLKDIDDVDVKDLLETGRVIIEAEALQWLFAEHSSDLVGLDGAESPLLDGF